MSSLHNKAMLRRPIVSAALSASMPERSPDISAIGGAQRHPDDGRRLRRAWNDGFQVVGTSTRPGRLLRRHRVERRRHRRRPVRRAVLASTYVGWKVDDLDDEDPGVSAPDLGAIVGRRRRCAATNFAAQFAAPKGPPHRHGPSLGRRRRPRWRAQASALACEPVDDGHGRSAEPTCRAGARERWRRHWR